MNRYEVLIGRFGNATKNPFWTQDTGHTPTSANTEYTLTVDIATANSVGSVGRIELYGTTSSTIYATADFAPVATNTWYETSASYVSDGTESETLGIRLKFGSSGSSDRIEFNDVRLDTAVVPEPTTTALLGLGGLALILRRRK
ncbi:MAG: PEP-CTERM sorting domain-containing protein [Verrucomicrobiae bacterium]|nr:PEP-CTERM sorting domain-containing protein [Verrucomicrobiae bacterium]NNJ86994.1 PEP-CTERM sorting domain-containing protein [Akkermansiaceae bacterium]